MSAPQPRELANAPGPRRRRHKAAGGRIAATGIGAGALLGIVGSIGAYSAASTPKHAPRPIAAAPPVTAPAPTPTTIVWRVVHRTIVVTDPPVTTAAAAHASTNRRVQTASYTPAPTQVVVTTPAPAPAPAPAPVVVAAPAPAPAAPACTGSKCP